MNNTNAKSLDITFNIPRYAWDDHTDKNRLMWELFGRYIGPRTKAKVTINVTN